MTTQTEAQRLAAKMKSYNLTSGYAWHCHKAGDELLRLEAANAELMEALNWLDKWIGEKPLIECANRVRKAIAKHGGAA